MGAWLQPYHRYRATDKYSICDFFFPGMYNLLILE